MKLRAAGRIALTIAVAFALAGLPDKPSVQLPSAGVAAASAYWATPDGQDTSPDPGIYNAFAPPTVVSVEPSGEAVPVTAPIQVTFSRPMNRGSVESSFSITPRVDGSLAWIDSSTLRFQPLRFAHAVTYRIDVRGRSRAGRPIKDLQHWQFTTAGGAPPAIAPGRAAIRVPILMYHYIRVNLDPRDRMGFGLSVTPADFKAQMDWLQANGFHTITFSDLNAYLSGARGLPVRPVILTFDDGYADFFTAALPVLVSHDFTAVAYVVSGFIGRPGYLSADQVLTADRAGIEIASHTVDHVDLTLLSNDSVRYQLTASRQSLEQLVGHPVLSFCYPYGGFNPRVAAAVGAAGYRDATTTQWGAVRALGGRYTWGRVRVSGGETLWQFAQGVWSAA